MSLGKTAIANVALTDIGAHEISDFDPSDGSTESDYVTTFWAVIRDEVLAVHNWDFAKGVKTLAEDAGYSIDDDKWEYAYELPPDCIKARYLSDKDYNYEIRDTHLLCNLSDGNAILIYTKRIEDTTKWDPLFIQAFTKRLGAALCRPLKRKASIAKDLLNEYAAMFGLATQSDAAQSNLTQDDQYRHTAANDSWLTARTS